MDHLSSEDLDSPSKTPLFLGIAAIVLVCVAGVVAWMGFSKANALELKLAELSSAAEDDSLLAEVQGQVDRNSEQLEQVINGFKTMREEVNKALGSIQTDISQNKKNIRGVTIQAGTALKDVKELEAKVARLEARPVQKVFVPAPKAAAPVAPASSKDNPEPREAIRATLAPPKESKPLEERKPKVVLPEETAVSTDVQIYRIKSGDYLSRVAAKFSVSLDEIIAANPGIDVDRLAIGQEIKIPKSK